MVFAFFSSPKLWLKNAKLDVKLTDATRMAQHRLTYMQNPVHIRTDLWALQRNIIRDLCITLLLMFSLYSYRVKLGFPIKPMKLTFFFFIICDGCGKIFLR